MCTLDCDYKVSLKYMTLLTWIWFENIITKKQEGDATNNLKDKCYVKNATGLLCFLKYNLLAQCLSKLRISTKHCKTYF